MARDNRLDIDLCGRLRDFEGLAMTPEGYNTQGDRHCANGQQYTYWKMAVERNTKIRAARREVCIGRLVVETGGGETGGGETGG